MKQAIFDLVDEVPKAIDNPYKQSLLNEDWIEEVQLRFRDEGHVFFGEVFIRPSSDTVSVKEIEDLRKKILNYHWRFHDIVIMPFKKD